MSSKYLFVGDHADNLGSGRRVAPGDDLPASAVDPDNPVDQRLLDEGVLVELTAKKEKE